MTRIRLARALFSSLWLAGAGAASAQEQPREPEFLTGDVARLECRVAGVRAVDKFSQLLLVEVHNRGTATAEPLEFGIELRERGGAAPRAETFRRVQLPLVRRYGRGAPPGGKQVYTLGTALHGTPAQYAVRVLSAAWHGPVEVARPGLKISRPTTVQRTSMVGTFPVTQIELTNPFDRDLDVLLLVTLAQPADLTELMGVRVPAGATLPWVLAGRAGPRAYLDAEAAPASALKATAFQLADWSLVGRADPEAGARRLRPAYERWYRWPDAATAVSGRFAFRERRQKLNSSSEYEDHAVTGRFTLPAKGPVRVEIDSGQGANAASAIASAFEQVRRPDFATFAARNRLGEVAADRVEVQGPGWLDPSVAAPMSTTGAGTHIGLHVDYQVAEDRIVGEGTGDGPRTTWQVQETGRGYLVTQLRSSSQRTTFRYREQDGLQVPAGSTSTTAFGDKLFSASELALSDLRFDGQGAVAVRAPTGEGAAALRALWDTAYRLPEAPIEIAAGFEVTHPGSDLIWLRQKRVKGTVTMTGIGRHLQALHLECEGRLPPEVEMALGAAFRDRLLMWHSRDFNDRATFESFFAGATIHAADATGTFRIENGPVLEVQGEGGLVRGWSTRDATTRFTYERIDGRMAVTRIESTLGTAGSRSQERWTETVKVTLTKVGNHLLPSMLRFERIFGRDWGPETITLKDLKVRERP
ncbi:MAG: hypothetical protein IT458_15110 [Planctomycetes bacterium]|nr:hypothetical protein [Planctomycetota bacterium]